MKINIFISGLAATGKTTLARDISTHLAWPNLEIGALYRTYYKWQSGEGERRGWNQYLNNRIRDLAMIGNSVIEGRVAGAIALVEDFYCLPKLNVLVKCEEDIRLKRYLERRGRGIDGFNRDLGRMEFLEKIYPSFLQERNYDIILDSTFLNQNDCLVKVLTALRAKQT